jgi:hypothetical protein
MFQPELVNENNMGPGQSGRVENRVNIDENNAASLHYSIKILLYMSNPLPLVIGNHLDDPCQLQAFFL